MLSELGKRPMLGRKEGSFGDDFEKEIRMLLHEHRRLEADDVEKELNLYRSGSAPPTVEGSLSAVGGLFGCGGSSISTPFSEFGGAKDANGLSLDCDFRSDPAYLSYYYANVNLNPRLPPPLLSREELRYAQRLKVGNSVLGGIGDRRKVNRADSNNGSDRSLFSMPPRFESESMKRQSEVGGEKQLCGSAEWGGDGLIGLPDIGLGGKQKSFAEIFQDDFGRSTPVTRHPSQPASYNAFDENVKTAGSAEAELALSHHELLSENKQGPSGFPPKSHTYATALGSSLSRSTTPDPQIVARVPSPCPTPIGAGRVDTSEKQAVNSPGLFNGASSGNNVSSDLVSALSGMNLSNNGNMDKDSQTEQEKHQNYMVGLQRSHAQIKQRVFSEKSKTGDFQKSAEMTNLSYRSDIQAEIRKPGLNSCNPYLRGSSTSTLNGNGGLPGQHQHLDNQNSSCANFGLGSYSLNPSLASMMAGQLGTGNLPSLLENGAAATALGLLGIDSRVLGGGLISGRTDRAGSQLAGGALQQPFVDPMYLQYLRTPEYAVQLAALNDPSMDKSFLGNNSYMNLLELQKAYFGSLIPQKSQFGAQLGGKYGSAKNSGYYGMLYPGSRLVNPGFPNSPVGPGSPMRQNELHMSYNNSMRNLVGGVMGPWHLDAGLDEGFESSLLDEFKNNKTKFFELSEIAGHVVEFSTDQYGSRFIQQKLETATMEEKTIVCEEIMPNALALMTDVFGNYVIQKFLEHGIPSQRRALAEKLVNNVLSLSLQMYGCRVIQKAIEVVDLDQKIEMVRELDGHIMRCVRDQNGNHVIQKCIECVPEENFQFIVSTFFDQIVTLSTHPYGCRVVQRVLEHCKDDKTQSKVLDEILSSVSTLAQDQYGNYVIQHVLEHGKPHERSIIIKELAGKIVPMSQQKFASNVVEKCVTFGDPSERLLLVKEMLGTTDENEPLQAMMKDQFGNYVVQKVLEMCDDQMRELILLRIKVHLNALKKYTYGKHIVARVEKLVAAGERRIAAQSLNPAQMA